MKEENFSGESLEDIERSNFVPKKECNIIKEFYMRDVVVRSDIEGDIEVFNVNGEMASVFWLRKGKEEYNGKYIEMIRYY